MKRDVDSMNPWVTIGSVIGCGALIWGLVILASMFSPDPATQTSRQVALTCTTDMATQFHIHPFLRIFAYGEEIPVPENMGITPSCMYSIHTHEDVPIVHVEAPVKKDFTLGDFFAVWQKPFSSTELMDYKVDGTNVITVSINGSLVDTYEETILRDQDDIRISIDKVR